MAELRGHKLVKHLIKEQGLTLQQVHERTCDEFGVNGIAVPDLSRIQNGRSLIGPIWAFKLARAFQLSPSCFIERL